jgi:hypothetical protein
MRKYTGWDGNAAGKRAGLEQLVKSIEAWTNRGLWNNGTWGIRDKKGKVGNPSVHSTGRACDLSWRKMANGRGCGDYNVACQVLDFLYANRDELLLEALFDYWPKPFGRGWKCDRDEWTNYSSRAFAGSPGGDWVHLEVANAKADDAKWYAETFDRCLAQWLNGPAEFVPAPINYTKEYAMKLVSPPVRVADTRKTGSFKAGETKQIKVSGDPAVFVNLTVVPKGKPGFVTAWGGGNMPDVSNVNFGPADPICNTSWIMTNGGAISIYSSEDCDILVDLQAVAK